MWDGVSRRRRRRKLCVLRKRKTRKRETNSRRWTREKEKGVRGPMERRFGFLFFRDMRKNKKKKKKDPSVAYKEQVTIHGRLQSSRARTFTCTTHRARSSIPIRPIVITVIIYYRYYYIIWISICQIIDQSRERASSTECLCGWGFYWPPEVGGKWQLISITKIKCWSSSWLICACHELKKRIVETGAYTWKDTEIK